VIHFHTEYFDSNFLFCVQAGPYKYHPCSNKETNPQDPEKNRVPMLHYVKHDG